MATYNPLYPETNGANRGHQRNLEFQAVWMRSSGYFDLHFTVEDFYPIVLL
jgi:hypothetical protein